MRDCSWIKQGERYSQEMYINQVHSPWNVIAEPNDVKEAIVRGKCEQKLFLAR